MSEDRDRKIAIQNVLGLAATTEKYYRARGGLDEEGMKGIFTGVMNSLIVLGVPLVELEGVMMEIEVFGWGVIDGVPVTPEERINSVKWRKA